MLNKSGGSKFTVCLNPTMKDFDRDVTQDVTTVDVQVPYGHQENQMCVAFSLLLSTGSEGVQVNSAIFNDTAARSAHNFPHT